jgi:hypothetical protein
MCRSRRDIPPVQSFFRQGIMDMAKGEQRSNREKKKPKQEKMKPAVTGSVFSAKPDFGKPSNSGKKK